MEVGLKNECQVVAGESLSAKAMGSGSLMVYATPAMVALMEQTAAESVEPFLGEGKTSVGTKIEVQHLAATPMGMTVVCRSELTAIEERKLTFTIEAFDEAGLIGKAYHERFIVSSERFVEKTYEKLKK